MDIAAISVTNSLGTIQNSVGIRVMKMAMDLEKTSSANLLSMLVPPSPNLGQNIDIKA